MIKCRFCLETSTAVYDRHEIGYAYGPLELFKSILIKIGFKEVEIVDQYLSVPHEHRYHAEFDNEESAVIESFDWKKSPLREQDYQK